MDVALHNPDTIFSPRHVPSWLLLCAAAGAVNGVAFVMCEQYVTHVTGTVTRMGLEGPRLGLMAEYGLVLLAFIAGAAVSVMWIQARARRGRRPQWSLPLIWVAFLLAGVAVAGEADWFGPFGGLHTTDPPPAVLLSVLAFAMGLQNASVASTTGLAVRTTHLTGPSTDLGVHIGTALMSSGKDRRDALRGAALRGGKVAAFMTGAALSLPLAGALGFLALLVPAAFVVAAAVLSFGPEWSASDLPFPPRDARDAPGDRRPLPEDIAVTGAH
jgi:uncharacterized membrane protein YoaK (UPF0700 family)